MSLRERERERELLLFLPGAALGTSTAYREAGLEEAQPWGQPVVVGGFPSPPADAGTEVQSSSDTLTLPRPAWAGLEGGSWWLASSPGIVLGLNGRQLGFSGDWKLFPSAALIEGAGEGPSSGEGAR